LKRYSILSVPRSGSSLLASALEDTGLLGVPLEYLNQNSIDAWKSLNGHMKYSLDQYLQDIERRRTSSNGYFGMKVHYRHFEQLYGVAAFDRALEHLRQQDFLILITRDDHLAQAISYFRARATGAWSSDHIQVLKAAGGSVPKIDYEHEGITDCLNEVCRGERGWLDALEASGVEYIHVKYEDLETQFEKSLSSILTYLGFEEVRIPNPRLSRIPVQGSEHLYADAFKQFKHKTTLVQGKEQCLVTLKRAYRAIRAFQSISTTLVRFVTRGRHHKLR
jgi:LPS sulfotransferase NodH